MPLSCTLLSVTDDFSINHFWFWILENITSSLNDDDCQRIMSDWMSRIMIWCGQMNKLWEMNWGLASSRWYQRRLLISILIIKLMWKYTTRRWSDSMRSLQELREGHPRYSWMDLMNFIDLGQSIKIHKIQRVKLKMIFNFQELIERQSNQRAIIDIALIGIVLFHSHIQAKNRDIFNKPSWD